MDRHIRVGLIGFGVGGQVFHAPVLTAIPGLKLTHIRASRPEQVSVARMKYPEARISGSAEEIINDKDVDLVVISTPHSSHHSLALQALQAGKHVMVDKPFTVTTVEADELIALAATRNLVLSVFHNRRFDSDFHTVDKVIKSGVLGELVEFESRYDRFRNFPKPGSWREEDAPGSGIWYDLGSHLIDQALTLFGLPEAVTADLRIQRKFAKAVDNFEVTLHYPSLKVLLRGGMLVKGSLPRFILLGTEGSFIKYGMDVQEEALKAGYSPLTKDDWGIEPQAIRGKINMELNGLHIIGNVESEQGGYTRIYDNLYQTIVGNEQLLVTPLQARNTIRIIELATRSQLERRTVDYSFS